MSKEIKLTKGYTAIVDDEDYEWLNQWSWYYHQGYACRTKYLGGGRDNIKNKIIRMHRLIMNTPDNLEVDHANGNKLDNRKSNLRNTNRARNMENKNKMNYKNATSRFKGVNERKTRYRVRIYCKKEYINIGDFTNEIAAANAYNYYAKLYHGEFAVLNNVEYMDDWIKYKKEKNFSSQYMGVSWIELSKKWRASLYVSKKEGSIHIGHYDTEIEAAKAHDEKAKEIFGDKAKLNFPEESH